MRVDFLGEVAPGGPRVVVEYDGEYWHGTDECKERDIDKTTALLACGFYVVRIREKQLPHLPLSDPNLLQLNVPWLSREEDARNVAVKIVDWVRGKYGLAA